MFLIGLKIQVRTVIFHLVSLEIQIIMLRRVQYAVDGFQARAADWSHRQTVVLVSVVRGINLQMIVEHPLHAVHAFRHGVHHRGIKLQTHILRQPVIDDAGYHRIFFRPFGLLLHQRRPDKHFFHTHAEICRLLLPLLVKFIQELIKNLRHQLIPGHILREVIGVRENVTFQLIKHLIRCRQHIRILEVRRCIFHRGQKLILTHNSFVFQFFRNHRNRIPFRYGKGLLFLLGAAGHQRCDHIIQTHAVVERKGSVTQLSSVVGKIYLHKKCCLIPDNTRIFQLLSHLPCAAAFLDGHLHRVALR